MNRFPSIHQFRHTIHHVKHQIQYRGTNEFGKVLYDYTAPLPTMLYKGAPKLHGTNSAVVYDKQTAKLTYQSREHEITLQNDNKNFVLHMTKNEPAIRRVIGQYSRNLTDLLQLVIFGEWCGEGINSGCAIHLLPKMFVIFAVRAIYVAERDEWLTLDPAIVEEDARIFCVDQFPLVYVDIDFARPEIAQQRLVELTDKVEQSCPVGRYFGAEGIGEGLIWQPVRRGLDSGYWFKVKGQKHSVSRVRTLAGTDPELFASMRTFVDAIVSEQRLLQGVEWLKTEANKPIDKTSTGDFIQWLFTDVYKEEEDTIVANQFDVKKLNSIIAVAARNWYLTYLMRDKN